MELNKKKTDIRNDDRKSELAPTSLWTFEFISVQFFFDSRVENGRCTIDLKCWLCAASKMHSIELGSNPTIFVENGAGHNFQLGLTKGEW